MSYTFHHAERLQICGGNFSIYGSRSDLSSGPSRHERAAHDTGYGNFNTERRYVETMKEVTDY